MNHEEKLVNYIHDYDQINRYLSSGWNILVYPITTTNKNIRYTILFNDKKAIFISPPALHATIEWFAIRDKWQKKGFDFIHYFIAKIDIFQEISIPSPSKNKTISPSAENMTLLTDLVSIAIAYQASDIYIELQEQQAIVYLRRYMQLHVWQRFPAQQVLDMLEKAYRLNTDSNPQKSSIFDRSIAQSAMIPIMTAGKAINLRYQSHPMISGLSIVLKILKMTDHCSFGLVDLGYTPQQIVLIKNALSQGRGGIFISGGTNSGKSTTLSVLMNLLGQMYPDKKRYALKGAMEYHLDGVMHLSTDHSRDITQTEKEFFSFLRMDPKIGMLDIKDKHTALFTKTAIETGQHILATIYATSSWGIIDRLSSSTYGLSRTQIVTPGFANLLVYQKLLPIVCPHCRIPAKNTIEPETLRKLCKKYGLDAYNIYCISEVGCPYCLPDKQARKYLSCLGIAGVTLIADVIDPAQHHPYKNNEGGLVSSDTRIQQHALHKVSMGLVDPRFLSLDGLSFQH